MVSGLTTLTCTPLHARTWFKWREPLNWAVSIAVGLGAFFVLLPIVHPLVAVLVGGAAAFWLCFPVLEKRAIYIVCLSCGNTIETNTPWICGNKECGHQNNRVDDFPFIKKCERCDTYPKAYQCHHCGKLIFFTKDEQKSGFARCANSPTPVETEKPPIDPHAVEVAKKVQDIQLKKLDVEEGKLDLELKGIKQTLEPPKQESVRARLRRRVSSKTELEDEVRKMHKEADEEFKDDPVRREQQHQLIDDEAKRMPY